MLALDRDDLPSRRQALSPHSCDPAAARTASRHLGNDDASGVQRVSRPSQSGQRLSIRAVSRARVRLRCAAYRVLEAARARRRATRPPRARADSPSLYDRVKSLLARRGFAVDSHDELIERFRRIYRTKRQHYDLYRPARGSDRIRRALLAVARPSRAHGRAHDRPAARHRRFAGCALLCRARCSIASSRSSGKSAPTSARGRTHERTWRRAVSEFSQTRRYLVSHSMGAAPLRARRLARSFWEEWASRRARGVGALAAAHRRDRRRHRRDHRRAAGSGLPRAERFGAASRDRDAASTSAASATKSFTKRCSSRRSPTCGASGSATGPSIALSTSDDGRTIPTERIIDAITERTALAVLSHAYYVSGAIADVRAIQDHCRQVGALLCVDAYQTTGIYPYDVTHGI